MEKKYLKLFYLFILLLPIIDLVTSLTERYFDFVLSIGVLLKAVFMAILGFYLLFVSKSKYKKLSIIYILLVLVFLCFNIGLSKNFLNLRFVYFELLSFFRYFFFPTLLVFLINIYDEFGVDERLNKVLMINCFTYGFLILLAVITKSSFASYSGLNQMGTSGWFFAANEIGAILLMLFPFSYLLIKYKRRILFLLVILLEIAMYMIGTKTILFGTMFLSMLIIILYLLKERKLRTREFIYSSLLFIFPLILTFYSPALSNLKLSSSNYDKSNASVIETNEPANIEEDYNKVDEEEIWLEKILQNERIKKMASLIFSGREEFYINASKYFVRANNAEKLFGIGFTRHEVTDKSIELDMVEICFRFGYVGFIIYFMPLLLILVYFVKKVFSKTFEKEVIETYFLFILIMFILGISFVVGHVLSAPAVSIYLALILILFMDKLKSFGKETKK